MTIIIIIIDLISFIFIRGRHDGGADLLRHRVRRPRSLADGLERDEDVVHPARLPGEAPGDLLHHRHLRGALLLLLQPLPADRGGRCTGRG